MIDWREIEDLPRDLASGCGFLFCTLSKHIFHVTLVVHNEEASCWSIEGAGANGKLLVDQDMALATHFADIPIRSNSTDHYRDRQRQEMHAADLASDNAATRSILSLRGATACW